MHRVVMPVAKENPSASRLQVSVHLQTDVVAPELILGECLVWRMDVKLTTPQVGVVGRVGRVELDATTGDVLTEVKRAQEMIANAYALTED